MSKRLQKFLCAICTISLLVMSCSGIAYAADFSEHSISATQIEELLEMSDDDFVTYLIDLGYSRSDALLLAEDRNSDVYSPFSPNTRGAFPSDPNPSDTVTIDYPVDLADCYSAMDVTRKLSSAGVPTVVAASIAAAIWAATASQSTHGVIVTITYTYGLTNDLVMGWTPGKTTWKLY